MRSPTHTTGPALVGRGAGALLVAALAFTALPANAAPASPAPANAPTSAAPAAAPTGAAECTLNPPASTQSESPTSCISAELRLGKVPAVGQSATVEVTLDSEVAVDRARLSIRLPQGLRITSDGFSAPQDRGLDTQVTQELALEPGGRTVTFTVVADEAGPAQIQADVTDVAAPAVERTAHASTELTVGKTAARSTRGVTGTTSEAHRTNGAVVEDTKAARNTKARALARAGADDVCATGVLSYSDYYGTWKPGRRVSVEVVGQTTTDAAPVVLSTGLTDTQGGYQLCFKTPSLNTAAMWVRYSTSNAWWEVTEMTGKTPYVVETAQKTNVSEGSVQDFGRTVPDALHMRAFHAFDAHNLVYDIRGSSTPCWSSEETAGSCSKIKARWAPGNTDGGYYSTDPAVRSVFLTDEMPDAPTTVVHEAGHNFQHLLYNWAWANGDCPSPHYLDKSSGPSCAWTEGFPNGIVAYVFEDGRYYYNVNTWMDLRQSGFSDPSLPASRTNPDNGDACECRIAGALYGLWTTVDGGPQRTFQNMDKQFSDSFEEWFEVDRPKTGLAVTAKARNQLYKYTIDYRKGRRAEAVTNGSLEDQGFGWTWTNGVVGTYGGNQPRTGRYYSWMGGNGVAGTDEMWQQVVVPATGTTLLDFYLRVASTEPTTAAADSFKVQVTGADGETQTVFMRTNKDKTSVYAHRVVDLSDWAGQSVTLRFVSTEDAGQQSDFLVDDVSVYTR